MRITANIYLLGILLVPMAAWAENPTVADLAWMTGDWSGPMGPTQTLEEHWIQPVGGTISALVRSTGDGKTGMIEMILIEEEAGSLTLRVQQWNPGFQPRTELPQTMKLVSTGDNSVHFESIDDIGGLKELGYSRPSDDAFHIHITTRQGASFTLKLGAM